MKDAIDALDLLRTAFDQECARSTEWRTKHDKDSDDEYKRSREWREKHDKEAVEFRTELLNEIKPFKEFKLSLSWFWKIALALSGLVWSVIKGAAWLKDHLK